MAVRPTDSDCIVALFAQAISLDDVEVASFERVQFNLRNFDVTFVFKDFDRAPIRIDAIPSEYFDRIREWLK